jgi:hypothetical protein
MANLLYVTKEVLAKLRQHPAYQLWSPIVNLFPIRIIPLDERSFHPRPVAAEENAIYLTVDMKFAYCRDRMFSFLYETQDLSFRLAAHDGILRTLDGKQFTALIGKIAEATSTSDIRLVCQDKTYHPWFDAPGAASRPLAAAPPPPAEPAPPIPANDPPAPPAAPPPAAPPAGDQLILGRYARAMCDQIVHFRHSSKKGFAYLAERFHLTAREVQDICTYYRGHEQSQLTGELRKSLEEIPADVQQTIIEMKKVAKKSYPYLAKRFGLPLEVVQDLCAQHLQRPRRRRPSP